jgi:hypothetical protein
MKKLHSILDVVVSFLFCLAICLLVIGFCSSCKILRKIDKSVNDSTSVSKSKEGAVSVDSSKYKKESDYTRTTFIYPPRDTNITVNNYYPQQPSVIIQETGKQKEEGEAVKYDNYWRERYDSLSASSQKKSLDSSTVVLPTGQLILFAVIIIIISVLLNKLSGRINFFKPKNTQP